MDNYKDKAKLHTESLLCNKNDILKVKMPE